MPTRMLSTLTCVGANVGAGVDTTVGLLGVAPGCTGAAERVGTGVTAGVTGDVVEPQPNTRTPVSARAIERGRPPRVTPFSNRMALRRVCSRRSFALRQAD